MIKNFLKKTTSILLVISVLSGIGTPLTSSAAEAAKPPRPPRFEQRNHHHRPPTHHRPPRHRTRCRPHHPRNPAAIAAVIGILAGAAIANQQSSSD